MTLASASWMPFLYNLYRWGWAVLDWFYPPHCGGCNQPGTRWCADCQAKTQLIPKEICPCCGKIQANSKICVACQTDPPHFSALRSWALFGGPLRNAIHRLKYQRDMALGEILARPLIGKLALLSWKVDLIAPVPIGMNRLERRGYNQAALLALPLALATGIPYLPQVMQKTRETRSQVDLTLRERHENVKGAFSAQRSLVAGKCILIVDDVATSGSTLNACAEALCIAGAREVFALTLARTP